MGSQGIQNRQEGLKVIGVDLDVALLGSKEHMSVWILSFPNFLRHRR